MRISYNEVSINHPEAIQVLAAPLWKSNFYKPFAMPNSNYNTIMSECDPKKNAMMRSNLTSGYAGSSVIKSEPFMDKTIQVLEQRLDDLSNKKAPFGFGLWLHFLTWDITGEVMFSKRFGFLDQGQDIGNSIKNNFFLALYLTLTVYAQWIHTTILGNPILRWLDFHPKEYTFNTTLKAIAARKENPEARADMMEQWMRQQARHPDRMTEHDVLCAAIANLGAASETVGSVLQAFFYLLLKGDPLHLQNTSTKQRKADQPTQFGLGYNSCPGRTAALIELNKITATLLRDFDLRLADPKAEWRVHELFVTAPRGWSVYVERRKAPGGEGGGEGLIGR